MDVAAVNHRTSDDVSAKLMTIMIPHMSGEHGNSARTPCSDRNRRTTESEVEHTSYDDDHFEKCINSISSLR